MNQQLADRSDVAPASHRARDLLTDEDWNAGTVIRFNLDSILRADFKSRQEGLRVQVGMVLILEVMEVTRLIL